MQPETVKMLSAGVFALVTKRPERHEVQVRVARMIEEVMETVKDKLQKSLDAAIERVAELERSKEGLESKVRQANEAMAVAARSSEAKALARCEASEKVKAAEREAQEKREAQREAEAELAKATESRDAYTVEQAQVDCVSRLEIGKAVADHTAKVEAAIVEATAAADRVDDIKSLCMAAVDEGLEATSREKQARDAALAAQSDLDNFDQDLEAALREKVHCAKTLDHYIEYNMGCLKKLQEPEIEEEVPAEV